MRESAPSLRVTLRCLRRLLHRQWHLAREERLDEALALDERLTQVFEQLQAIEASQANPAGSVYSELRAQCAELNDRIQPLLDHELRLLKREWVELQVDQELGRLARDSGRSDSPLSNRRGRFLDRQTDLTEPER